MEQKKYKSYKRIHSYDYPYDEETSKISKEKTNYLKLMKKTKILEDKITRNFYNCNEDDFVEFEEQFLAAERERKTAKNHKKRLKTLSKNEDFY